jgi:hypothetical protein
MLVRELPRQSNGFVARGNAELLRAWKLTNGVTHGRTRLLRDDDIAVTR